MDRPATSTSATARDIILEIVRNMRDGLEPLYDSTLPPSIFYVYLHTSDMERLRGILPRIIDDSRRALDAEVNALNRGSLADTLAGKLKIPRRGEPKVAVPEGGWQIRILENTEEEVGPGDIEIRSELAMPSKAEIGSGSMTKRIATRRMGGVESPTKQTFEAPPAAPAEPAAAVGSVAVIEYEDNGGRKSFTMVKDEIVVGRGGRDYWTDLKLDTVPDVSREHCRLRRDAATGQFFLTDTSSLGTTIDGAAAVNQQETPVPAKARIGLAGVVFLEFRSTANA